MKNKTKKNITIELCPHCFKAIKFICNGTRNGLQRLICSKCGKIFKEPEYSRSSHEGKKLISALINIIEKDISYTDRKYKKFNVLSLLKFELISEERLKNIKFSVQSVDKDESNVYYGYPNHIKYHCKADAIISFSDNEFKIIKFCKNDENSFKSSHQ